MRTRSETSLATTDWGDVAPRDGGAADVLLRVVDWGLIGVICVAPFFFGGRHDVGRLVLVSLVAVTAAAWFARQAIVPSAVWPRSLVYGMFLLAAALLVIQIVPLPPAWVAKLSPRTPELLALWAPGGSDAARLGTWQTLSLTPHETTKSLAMLASYGLLFVVVAGRIQGVADARRLLNCVAASAVLMAAFGIVHYFTTDGRFFWFYAYPHRSASQSMSGAFINRNHFAHFLVLGIGPLVAWLLVVTSRHGHSALDEKAPTTATRRIAGLGLAAALVLVTLGVLGSRSRGGAVVLLVAGAVLVAIYMYRRIVDSRFLYGVIGLAVVVVGLLSLYGYNHVVQRLDDLTEGSIDEIDQDGIRRKVWSANIESIKAGWLTGSGAGSHREICPVYLKDSLTKEYSYAENGYLQVATETGVGGVILLSVAIGIGGSWCLVCLRHARERAEICLFGGAAAGLAASAVHSFVDFVWYIPACMSVTMVLAGCVLRLSQLARAAGCDAAGGRVLRRGRWVELAAAAILIGAWSVQTYIGPAVSAIHWDRYRRTSIADGEISQESFAQFAAGQGFASNEARRMLSQTMLRQLHRALEWDPHFARAHMQLADRYLAEFELRVSGSANVLDVRQIGDAARSSSFASEEELHAWLNRAFGADVDLLLRAHDHARRAVELCPLQGGAYLHLADLAFLELGRRPAMRAYVDQALRLRPCDRNVLADAGVQALLLGEVERAFACWSKCFNTPGPHQQRIIYRLVVSGMPSGELLMKLQPDWRTLREIWGQYRKSRPPEELADILSYAADQTRREASHSGRVRSAYIWYWQSNMYAEVGRHDEALGCLEHAYSRDSRQYPIRYALAKALLAAGRFAEAEPHVRWCLARRPADKSLNEALPKISKHRLAQREAVHPAEKRPTHVGRSINSSRGATPAQK
jgi:tetratricopeptide (TPR) repeat protein